MSGTIDLDCNDAGIGTDRGADESNGGSSSGSVRRVGGGAGNGGADGTP